MTQTTHATLSAFDRNGISLRNRFAVAPMTRVSATRDGLPTERMQRYYARFARGGFGLVITEGLYTDQAYSQGYAFQPGLANDAQAQAWAPLNAQLQSEGAQVFAQLMHAGALSQANRFTEHSIAPSAVQPKGQQMAFYYGDGPYRMPIPMAEAQMEQAIQGFVDAATRAADIAGFNGIEIHGANGYLLDQFLTADTNRRTDRWGGDVEARVSFLVEVLRAVKAKIAGKVPVGIRISQGKVNDFTSKWPGGETDAKAIFGALAAAGADFIHVTEFEAWQPAFEGGKHSLLALARRHAPGVPLIANGSLHAEGRAELALDQGADIVAMGRGALANPDLPVRAAASRQLRDFDSAILGPIADVKARELALDGAA